MKASTILAALSVGFVAAAPTPQEEAAPAFFWESKTCTSTLKRKEWRNMSTLEQTNFIVSVKCLMKKAPKYKAQFPAVTNRYEDFLAVHQANTPFVHFNGAFLPWHRAFMREFELALKDECGYFFGLPYWDVTQDFANITASPVLSPGSLGFGGNGIGDVVVPPGGQSSDGNCVQNGAFANMTLHLAQGPVLAPADRCLLRYIKPEFGAYWFNPGVVAEINAQPNFNAFTTKLDGDILPPNPFPGLGIHSGAHATIGGDMSDMFTSNSDPIFYPFHANLDRLWALWQAAAPATRQWDVAAPIAPRGVLNMWPNPPAGDVTLDYPLEPLKLGTSSTIKVGQLMDIKGKGVAYGSRKPAGVMCYEYV